MIYCDMTCIRIYIYIHIYIHIYIYILVSMYIINCIIIVYIYIYVSYTHNIHILYTGKHVFADIVLHASAGGLKSACWFIPCSESVGSPTPNVDVMIFIQLISMYTTLLQNGILHNVTCYLMEQSRYLLWHG